MKNKFKVLALLLVLCFPITLISCGKKNDANKNLQQVDLVLDWYPNAVHSFIYDAIEKGYYKKEGLKINIKFPTNTSDPLSLVGAGKATFGIYYPEQLINAVANEKVPVKSVGALLQSGLSVVISKKDQNIKSPKDLDNKTIGYSGDPLTEAIIRNMIKNDKGDPNNIKLIDVGFDIISSMVTNRVNVTTGGMVNHEVPVMENKGITVNYFYPSDYGIPNVYELVFVANNKTIKDNPELVKKFLRASKKGFEDVQKDPNKTLDILLNHQEKDNFPLTKSVEETSMKVLLPKMQTKNAKFLSQKSDVWEKNIDWLYDNKFIKNKIKPTDVFININQE